MKPVKDIMRNLPSSCEKYDSIETVASRMSLSSLEFLPVVNERSEVIGTITYDAVQQVMSANKSYKENLRVVDVMKTQTHMVNTNDDEAAALKIMRNNHASYLPVVDDENHLRGVVSFMTLARRIIRLKQQLKKDGKQMRLKGIGISI